MSTYAELELRCKRRLGRRGMTITTEFLDEMQAAQEKLGQMPTFPKWMKTTSSTEITVAGSPTVTDLPPADFIRVYDDRALSYYAEDDVTQKGAIRLDTKDQLISKRNAGVVSNTIYWFLDEVSTGPLIAIAPIQTRDVRFFMAYYQAEEVFTGSNTNDWCAEEPDQIMGRAGEQLAVWLRDDRALKYFQGLHEQARGQMIRRIEADEWGDTDLVMGDPD